MGTLDKIIIAIDGHSSCGKSTLAKDLAKALGFSYISSGKMYRAVTFYFLENNVDYYNENEVAQALKNIKIHFENQGDLTFLNNINVEDRLRSMEVANNVSPVATIHAVREEMVRQQQVLGLESGIVMDGRDIGTVVFTNAELKIFLSADSEIRAQRRYQELVAKGMDVNLEEVRENLLSRDKIDSTREHSPLRKAPDAVLVDNSNLSREEQMVMLLALSRERMKSSAAKRARVQ